MKAYFKEKNNNCVSELQQFIADSKNFAYFFGSGISEHEYPVWKKLPLKIKEIFETNGWPWNQGIETNPSDLANYTPDKLQEIFQNIANLDTNNYIKSIELIFEAPPVNHRDFLFSIIKSNPRLIVTLNYDISIQSAFKILEKHEKLTQRIFPLDLTISHERENTTVLYHLHGKFHDQLNSNPDWIVLHKGGYDYAYRKGTRPIRSVLKSIFLDYDVIFVGTRMTEPEMAEFFRVLTDRVKRGGINRRRLALLASNAFHDKPDLEKLRNNYELERSNDYRDYSDLGIETLRFFPLNSHYRGLNDIITQAIGSTSKPSPTEISW